MNSQCNHFFNVLVLLLAPSIALAAQSSDSWIFRSEVAPNQSMWGPNGPLLNHEYMDGIFVSSGVLQGTGVGYSVQADIGTVSGNVEGILDVSYDDFLSRPGKTNITLSFDGLSNESLISTNFGATLGANARLKVDLPWWAHLIPPFIPDIDISLAPTFVDLRTDIDAPSTTGLNKLVTGSTSDVLLPVGLDLLVATFQASLNLKQSLYFLPQNLSGTLKATNRQTMTQKLIPFTFDHDIDHTNDGTMNDDRQILEIDLNEPGHWELSIEDFSLEENLFSQDLDLTFKLAAEVPIVQAKLEYETSAFDFFNLFESEFELDFLAHGFDGDSATADRVGRFFIYVQPVPLPPALWLFATGMLSLGWLKRRSLP